MDVVNRHGLRWHLSASSSRGEREGAPAIVSLRQSSAKNRTQKGSCLRSAFSKTINNSGSSRDGDDDDGGDGDTGDIGARSCGDGGGGDDDNIGPVAHCLLPM